MPDLTGAKIALAFTCVKPPCFFLMRLPNHLDSSNGGFICQGFFIYPWWNQGFCLA